MKKFIYLIAASLFILLTACSKDSDVKQIKPTSTEFANGDLTDYLKITDDCELKWVDKGGEFSTQIFQLKVNVEVINDEFQNCDPSDINYERGWNLCSIDLVDENGIAVLDNIGIKESKEQLMKLLTKPLGTKGQLTFEETTHNGDAYNLFFEKITNFTLVDSPSKFKSSKEEEEARAAEAAAEAEFIQNIILPSTIKNYVEVIAAETGIDNGYPKVTVTFNLLKTMQDLSSVSTRSGNQVFIYGIGQTEKGVDVNELLPNYREWRTNDYSGDKFQNFLKSEPGETLTLEFTGSKENADDVEESMKKVKRFKLNFNTGI